jgi:hypothetical protein
VEIMEKLNPFDISKGSNFAWQSYIDDPSYALTKNRPIQLVKMSPDKYIEEVAKGFSSYGNTVTPQDLINQRTNSNMLKIMDDMKAGSKFPTPFIEYPKGRSINQEGLHRAVAAKNLGIKEMPVYLQQIGPDYGDTKDTVRRLAKRAYKYGPILKKLFSLPLNELGLIPEYAPYFDIILTRDEKQKAQKVQKLYREAGIETTISPDGKILFKI